MMMTLMAIVGAAGCNRPRDSMNLVKSDSPAVQAKIPVSVAGLSGMNQGAHLSTVHGVWTLPPGRYRISAAYSSPDAKELDRMVVGPKDVPWKGKLDLPAVAVEVAPPATQPADPTAAWAVALSAMQAGDKAALAKVTTDRGLKSLMDRRGQDITADGMRSLGRAWAKWPLRFARKTGEAAHANMGPEVKEHGLVFLKTTEGWKLDQWTPATD